MQESSDNTIESGLGAYAVKIRPDRVEINKIGGEFKKYTLQLHCKSVLYV